VRLVDELFSTALNVNRKAREAAAAAGRDVDRIRTSPPDSTELPK
jgi:hypothetical protein